MEYQIITGLNTVHSPCMRNLEERVREEISLGWKPLGGVSTVEKGRAGIFYAAQAMVKHPIVVGPDATSE